jgi:hypothetical protein
LHNVNLLAWLLHKHSMISSNLCIPRYILFHIYIICSLSIRRSSFSQSVWAKISRVEKSPESVKNRARAASCFLN